jgi:hypothetical protein
MKELFTTKGYYHSKAIEFTVSKISDNLYLADCNDEAIKRFIINKVSGVWTSDNKMTQSITARIGTMIEKTDNNRMQKIQDFMRSCFTPTEPETEQKPVPMVIQNLARV